MVVEREPPRAPLSPHKANKQTTDGSPQPVFGKTSTLYNPLHSRANIFNLPKPNQPRPEHHRPTVPSASHGVQPTNTLARPTSNVVRTVQTQTGTSARISDPDLVEIPRPANHPTWTTKPAKAPLFSSQSSAVLSNFVDLTSNQGRSLSYDDGFGTADPYTYIDTEKANENIKALLEGAFEDDEDKPRTRGRKKKVQAEATELADKLKVLAVGDKKSPVVHEEEAEKEQNEEEGEDEEEVDDGTVEGLKVKLLPHQVEGVSWMVDKEIGVRKKKGVLPKGGILADDMGLGKTIQSLALILTNPLSSLTEEDRNKRKLPSDLDKGTLVVAPLALIKQWEAEINNRVDDSHKLRVCVHHGPQRTKRFQDLKKYDVVITTYQILVSEHGGSSSKDDGLKVGCFGLHWYRVILDEAHTIKNRNAKATQACCALRAEYRWCLTGTPMQNNLDELQSLIKFLRIKPYNDLAIWRDQITRPLSSGRGGVAIKRLQFYLKAFMKRRTKDLLKQEGALNPGGKPSVPGGPETGFKITERKVEEIVTDFSKEERRFYKRLEDRTGKSLEQMMEDDNMNYASALVLLLRLRQACNHPELTRGSMAKDRDALTTGGAVGAVPATPRKSKAIDKELDDVADLLGGLSVATKKCDVCQIKLNSDEMEAGAIRCTECEGDLSVVGEQTRKGEKHKHRHSRRSQTDASPTESKPRRLKNRKVIVDSDDEEEGQGDWLVPEDQREVPDLGKAGGTDDEDAEGGGESIGSEDSETEEDSDSEPLGLRNHKKEVIAIVSEEDENSSSASSTSDEESDGDSLPSRKSLQKKIPHSISTKIRHLLKILRRESPSHKFIVFSQFTSMLDLVEPFLKRDGLVFTRYDGSMKNDAREASLTLLRTNPRTRILLCSLKCGSLGLNLTAASRVVIMEPFWNPFVEEQAIDRVHRLNQTVDVVVYKLTVRDTVEEKILELQEKKRELANATVEGNKAAMGKLSMADILNLFGRDAEFRTHDNGVAVGVGGRTRVLGGRQGSGGDAVAGASTASDRDRRDRMMANHKKVNATPEDSLYSRRW